MEKEELKEVPKMKLLTSVDVVEREIYVFDVLTNSESTIAASLSDHTIKVLDPEKLTVMHCWKAHQKQITELKFSPHNHNHLLSSSLDGSICLWDLRESPISPSQCFQDLTSDKPKPLFSFDLNCTGSYLCGGTELIVEDAYIIFWDTRNTKLLGGYWDSHTEDVTQLKFHPIKKDILISGSVDGLINIFDISESTEEDALQYTLNTGSSVYKLNWIPEHEDKLSCLTHTHDFQVWKTSEASPCISKSRDEFNHVDGIEVPVDYLIDVLKTDSSNIELMSGTFNNTCHVWKMAEDSCSIKAILMQGHSGIVRTCCWDDKRCIYPMMHPS